ncbi:hypothetical protein BMW23_0130 [Bodo saltans virus]|uniref:Fucosyltransferase C-terminal domain-containing protein n=1 Tax=Bodo saltans virus TaxID=2024608 RepID=A0A2H4UTC4_9VIRU|nr:hypothetical protein QJ851_gp0127 [Bodo saltans virus]ATZ80190.1 hypothetical protein BMW23_0130 [Bodo saltans virus]
MDIILKKIAIHNNMKLYFLTPYPYDITYNNYMNNYFKLNNWDEFKTNKMEFIYINKYNQNIHPDFNKDYILVCDIQSIEIINYYDSYICLFKKENRIVFIYECLMHLKHQWKIDYVKNNFSVIFQNCTDIKGENIFWIPCWNLYIDQSKYTSNIVKKKFCAVSPIFDLGLSEQLDIKRIERIKIIKEYCENERRIHVYGNEQWENYIPLINFIGKLPNEDNCGLYGNINLEEKIINKCKVLSNYKFILVFESMFVNGFVTEKLIESLYTDSVVIYYGAPNIKEINNYCDLFNNGIINGHDYDVKELLHMMQTMNNTEYENRINHVKLIRNKLNYESSSHNIKNIIMNKIRMFI